MRARYRVHADKGEVLFQGSLAEVINYVEEELFLYFADCHWNGPDSEFEATIPMATGEHVHISVFC